MCACVFLFVVDCWQLYSCTMSERCLVNRLPTQRLFIQSLSICPHLIRNMSVHFPHKEYSVLCLDHALVEKHQSLAASCCCPPSRLSNSLNYMSSDLLSLHKLLGNIPTSLPLFTQTLQKGLRNILLVTAKMRTSIRKAAPSSQTKIKHKAGNFVEDTNAPVSLIEVRSDGSSRKSQVTKSLVETYIQNDFQAQPNKQPGSSQQPEHETIKLLCAYLFLALVDSRSWNLQLLTAGRNL